MSRHRQAFFHGSDAYTVDAIGARHTWFKLATPRIESLRQAFIGSDSRMRIAYARNGDSRLDEVPDPPDVTVNKRPWLKSVTVRGGASFFGGPEGRETHFQLSPDLTCIIGGSMTGKSTLLDGLRVHVDAPPPSDDGLASQVTARGRDGFLGGSPEVSLDCPGRDPTAPAHERWPAVFYSQNELQRLAQDPGEVQNILARLVAAETAGISAREARLTGMDRELAGVAGRLSKLDDDLAVAEQGLERCRSAAAELAAFSDAGVADLHRASRDFRSWQDAERAGNGLATSLNRVLQVADGAGRLDEQVDRAVGWFLGLGRFESYRNLVREDRHLLPRAAIREALVNAAIHRDYAITGSATLIEVFADRVDVTSPGALPNHMTVDQVRAGANPRARNDSMGHFMAGMGFMERRGRGWLIMRRAMRAFNATEPDMIQNGRSRCVRVTFRLHGEAA